jgi:folate-dependent tRNA-U54 methylase TrmFO/GidA
MFSPDVREFLLGHQKADDLTTAALLEFWQKNPTLVHADYFSNNFAQTRDRFHDLAVQYMNLKMKKEQAIMCLSASFWDHLSELVLHI